MQDEDSERLMATKENHILKFKGGCIEELGQIKNGEFNERIPLRAYFSIMDKELPRKSRQLR